MWQKKNMAWFGESGPFMADAENEFVREYKTAEACGKIPGYSIEAFAPGFDGYQEFAEWAFDDTTEKRIQGTRFLCRYGRGGEKDSGGLSELSAYQRRRQDAGIP